jgi:iron complex outermembrane receptor protein
MISTNSLPTHGAIFRRVALLSVIGTAATGLAQTAALPPREPAASLAPSFARLHDSTRNRGTAPYDVLERAELRQSGYSTIVGALQAELPTVNQPHPAIDDGTAHLPPFTVRGLSPDHTQVLVNGHPRHATALLNVNGTIGRGSVTTALMSLPMAALDHLEVLRDGSDARFGSGAIAGVINVQLREEIDRKALVLFGRTAEGDGEVKQVAFGAGGRLGRDGFVNVTAVWRNRGATDRATPDTRQQYFGTSLAMGAKTALSGNIGSGTGPAPAGIAFDPREATVDRNVQSWGDADYREQALVLNSRLPLSAQSELYTFADFLARRGVGAAYVRRPGDSRVVRALWPDGFMPLLESRIYDWNLGTGWRGRSNGWTYDAAVVGGANTIAYDVRHTNNPTMGLLSPREFYTGKLGYSEAVASLDLARALQLGLTSPANLAFGLQYRRENYWIEAGAENSWRDYGISVIDGPDAGRHAPEGAQGFPGYRPIDVVDAVRQVGAAYAEITQSIGSRLLLSASSRVEKTESRHETVDGKFAARLELWGGLTLRGSVGTTHRQAHLAQQEYSSTAINFISGTPYRIRTFTVADPVARALDATPLRPEHGETSSAGLAWEPSPKFGAEVDFYRVDVRDRLILTSNFIGSAVATFLEGQGINDTSGGRFFSNGAATRTEGFDAALNSKWSFGPENRLVLRAAYNRNKSRMTYVGPTPSGLAAAGVTTPLFDLTEAIRLTYGQPLDNLRLSAMWTWGRLQTHLNVMRYGQVEAVALTNVAPEQIAALTPGYRVRLVTRTLSQGAALPGGAPQFGGTTEATDIVQVFDAKWVTDLNFRLRLTDRIHWSLGASNLFDIYPTRNLPSRIVNGRAYSGSDNAGTTPYSTTSPFGFNGAFYYSRFDLQF